MTTTEVARKDEVFDGEIVDHEKEYEKAHALTVEIKNRLATLEAVATELVELVGRAYNERVWVGLDYRDWAEWIDREVPQLKKIRHDRSERRQLVQALCEIEGLSNRAAANVIGADERTVRNDLKASSTAENSAPAKRLGKDGKSRPVKQPKPKDFSDLRAKNEYGRTMSLANLMHEVANEAAFGYWKYPQARRIHQVTGNIVRRMQLENGTAPTDREEQKQLDGITSALTPGELALKSPEYRRQLRDVLRAGLEVLDKAVSP